MVDISIVIVNWNVKEEMRDCLKSLIKISRPKIEIIMVDNNSSDGSVKMIKAEFPQVKVIANSDNRGFAKACNQGIIAASGKNILLLNPDTEMPENSLANLLDISHKHPEAAIIGPKLIFPDGRAQPSIRRFPTVLNQTFIQLKLHHLFPGLKFLKHYLGADVDYSLPQYVDQIMGAAFFIPKNTLYKFGGLDERFFIWFEEVDYCLQVRRAGGKVLYTPEAEVIHRQGHSFFQLESTSRQKMRNDSLVKYFFKNHGTGAGLWFLFLNPVSLFLAFLTKIARVKPRAS